MEFGFKPGRLEKMEWESMETEPFYYVPFYLKAGTKGVTEVEILEGTPGSVIEKNHRGRRRGSI